MEVERSRLRLTSAAVESTGPIHGETILADSWIVIDLQAKPTVTDGGTSPTRPIGRMCRSGSELCKKVRVTDFGSTSCAASRKRNVSLRYGVGSTLNEGRVSSRFTAREFRIRNCRSSNFDALE